MTIHHDKLAYGKLASMREDCSDEDIYRMAELLNEDEEESVDEGRKKEK